MCVGGQGGGGTDTREQFIDGGTLSQAAESRLEASLGCVLMEERGAGSGVQTRSPTLLRQ